MLKYITKILDERARVKEHREKLNAILDIYERVINGENLDIGLNRVYRMYKEEIVSFSDRFDPDSYTFENKQMTFFGKGYLIKVYSNLDKRICIIEDIAIEKGFIKKRHFGGLI